MNTDKAEEGTARSISPPTPPVNRPDQNTNEPRNPPTRGRGNKNEDKASYPITSPPLTRPTSSLKNMNPPQRRRRSNHNEPGPEEANKIKEALSRIKNPATASHALLKKCRFILPEDCKKGQVLAMPIQHRPRIPVFVSSIPLDLNRPLIPQELR